MTLSMKVRASVIVLIALQVLAVEMMDKQGGDYTEHAYFPRLRSLIDDELTQETSLPFHTDEYLKFWETFASEVTNFYKSKTPVLTFDLEATNVFKNKIMPLSQALLSHADLVKLGMSYHSQYEGVDIERVSIENFLRGEKRNISPRGRECISKLAIRSQIISQFKGLFLETTLEQLVEMDVVVRKAQDQFEVILRLEEDLEATYDYVLEFRQQGNDDDSLLGMSRLVNFIDSYNYLCIVSTLDYLQGGNKFSKVLDVDHVSFLVINEKNINYIEASVGVNNLEYKIIDIGINEIKLIQLTDRRLKGKKLSIFNGRLKSGTNPIDVQFLEEYKFPRLVLPSSRAITQQRFMSMV